VAAQAFIRRRLLSPAERGQHRRLGEMMKEQPKAKPVPKSGKTAPQKLGFENNPSYADAGIQIGCWTQGVYRKSLGASWAEKTFGKCKTAIRAWMAAGAD
jgi:hypothetical protein